ncbi:hypothetical protein HKO22_03025 [Peptoniphilus sp. AGMB00490]|uniref:Uncharacterized protein n=1 Tax=Peptoniphilus faecalis TaxID=2731255 RepID=A0A848R636_9FIRM|nr:hypothetical protein [Peptoniphilus faecalis]NMW84717.1 hypothetical protein [Peptoniphilus faecalis]
MKIRKWKLYTANNEFIVNLKIFFKSTLIIAGVTILLLTILLMIAIYGHNIFNVLMQVL